MLKLVMEARQDLLFSVSATTRQMRPGEVDGVNYYYITREEFEDRIRRGEFLEYDEHNGTLYGTLNGQIREKLTRGNVILDVEPVGAGNVRKAYPDATLIFIMPPSRQELEERLRGRGDTSQEQIRLRLDRAEWEIEQKDWYDYVVVNRRAQTCAEEILRIIAEKAD